PPARHWVHGEHLLMAGLKMAKSAGNFLRITDLTDAGVDPLAFRYLVLTSRYSRKLNYTDESVNGAAAALASLRSRLAALGPPPRRPDRAHGTVPPLSAAGRALHERFVAALDDDLDLPTALAVVRETVRAALPADERRWLVLDADFVLGLDLDRVWEPRPATA